MSLEIKMTHQSFKEAGGKEVYPNLEIVEPVLVIEHSPELIGDETYVARLHKRLDHQAKQLGATHIFGIKYEYKKFIDGYQDFPVKALGTAYGSEKR